MFNHYKFNTGGRLTQKSKQPSNIKPKSNFNRLVFIASCTKLADLLISAKTTLPWILTHIGAQSWLISTLVPLRESGALIPQWLIKQRTNNINNRLILWRIGIAIQAICIMSMLLAVLLVQANYAGLLVVFALLILSLGRALCSLSMKDIQGINVKKGRRGKLVGIASSVSGLLSVISAVMLLVGEKNVGEFALFALLGFASLLFITSFIISHGLISNIEDNHNQQNFQLGVFNLLKQDKNLRNLVVNRCLLLHSALIAPYFVIETASGSSFFLLPYFIMASALASFVSSYLWGKLADISAVNTLLFANLVCILAALIFYFAPLKDNLIISIGLFFFLNIGYSGIRTGRKTYLLDVAEGKQRTVYVASANTIVGIVLLLLGGIYALLQHNNNQHIILMMTGILIVGFLHTLTMKKEK